MTRLAALLALIAAAIAPLAHAQTSAPPPPEKLDVLLDWYVNPDHAPLVVTLERGYFREAGLDVRLIAPSDPNDPPKLVAAGKAEIAVSYQPHLHIQTSRGLPLTRIGTLVARLQPSWPILERRKSMLAQSRPVGGRTRIARLDETGRPTTVGIHRPGARVESAAA